MKINYFQKLSEILIANQNAFNYKVNELRNRTRTLASKLENVSLDLESDPFESNITILANIEEESKLILFLAKEVEAQRDKLINSTKLLEESNKQKLNR
jgi:hypothetical protein